MKPRYDKMYHFVMLFKIFSQSNLKRWFKLNATPQVTIIISFYFESDWTAFLQFKIKDWFLKKEKHSLQLCTEIIRFNYILIKKKELIFTLKIFFEYILPNFKVRKSTYYWCVKKSQLSTPPPSNYRVQR